MRHSYIIHITLSPMNRYLLTVAFILSALFTNGQTISHDNVQQILSDILTAQKALQGAVILSDMKGNDIASADCRMTKRDFSVSEKRRDWTLGRRRMGKSPVRLHKRYDVSLCVMTKITFLYICRNKPGGFCVYLI